MLLNLLSLLGFRLITIIRAPDHPPQASEKSEVFLFRNVEISAFREWCQLIRSIDRVSLEVLHFSKKCYSPGGAMTAGIFAFMPVLFRDYSQFVPEIFNIFNKI